MPGSHKPYRWIRLPISRAWRLEVGKHQVWRWSWEEFMLHAPRPSSPADMSSCAKPIRLEEIMTLRRVGAHSHFHSLPDTQKEYLIALNNCILTPTQVHVQPLVCNRQSCKHIGFDIRYATPPPISSLWLQGSHYENGILAVDGKWRNQLSRGFA